jgi:DNA-binding GntR family transcriptional regulator
LESQSAEDKAYKAIIRLILEQKYPPGSSLVEAQLAEELDMSRTPIRSALRRLTTDGFLENPFNRSCRVPSVSRKDLEKLFDLRLLLEVKAASEAALNADESRKEEFEQLIALEREEYYTGDMDIYVINQQIHFGIANLSDNIYLEGAMKPLFWRSELYVFFLDTFYVSTDKKPLLRDPDKSRSHNEHKSLIEAIFSHSHKDAALIMKSHILSTKNMLTTNASFRRGFVNL